MISFFLFNVVKFKFLLIRKLDWLIFFFKFKSVEKCFFLKVRGRFEEDFVFVVVIVELE